VNLCDLLADRVPTTADPPTPTTDPDPYAAAERLVLGRRHPGRPGPHGSPCLGRGGHHQRAGRGRQLRTYDGSRCGDRASHRPRHHGRLLREPRRARALRDHPDLAAAPAHSDRPYRSTARYDVDPGRFGRAVAKFEAATAGSTGCRRLEPSSPARRWRWVTQLRQGHRPHRPGRRLAGAGDGRGGADDRGRHLPGTVSAHPVTKAAESSVVRRSGAGPMAPVPAPSST
jgi:hypothetical protein